MNDFTKEELESILYCHAHSDFLMSEELLNKIQSIIDNYCENEWDDAKNRRKYFRCSKCRKAKV